MHGRHEFSRRVRKSFFAHERHPAVGLVDDLWVRCTPTATVIATSGHIFERTSGIKVTCSLAMELQLSSGTGQHTRSARVYFDTFTADTKNAPPQQCVT